MLLGRQRERGVLDRLLVGARDGHGGAIVVLGEPGIGKTALIEQAVTSAQDFRVLRTAGQEGESELAYAALVQLCAPGLDRLVRLPAPQRDAMRVAFGLCTGDPPDRLLVALALLTLLSEMAAERPLLCVVDDAQWLDRASAQAVAFVARRLATEAVAFLFGAREVPDGLRGLPEMVVEGLGDGDARALFGSVFPYRLDEPVLDRIVAETNGNPLALLELPRGPEPGPAGRRVRVAGVGSAGRAYRGELPAAPGGASLAVAAPPAGRRGRSDGGRRAGVAGCWAARHRRLSGRGCRGRGPSGLHRGGGVPSPAGPLRRLRRRHLPEIGDRRTRRWRRQPIPPSTRIAGPGTAPRPRHAPTKTWRPTWSSPLGEPRPAAGSRRRLLSWNGRPS